MAATLWKTVLGLAASLAQSQQLQGRCLGKSRKSEGLGSALLFS